jgi:RNase H-like domain found in reverse transcriptase
MKGTFKDHLEKLERVLYRLRQAGLKINGNKLFFAKTQLEYLGYWITRDRSKPLPDKVKAILAIHSPKNCRELCSFIGIINYYQDMWVKRSHVVLAPVATLTSNKNKWDWGPQQDAAFNMAKKIIAREVMLAYPDFNEPFEIHTDASHYQLGAVISQKGKPIAFYNKKLNPAQTRYTTTERELLSIVETFEGVLQHPSWATDRSLHRPQEPGLQDFQYRARHEMATHHQRVWTQTHLHQGS